MSPSALAPLASLLLRAEVQSAVLGGSIPASWMQGRTTYGGCSAALCLQGALAAVGDTSRSLRSAQVTFIGAAGGEYSVKTSTVRQGKSLAYVESDLHSGAGLATRALFCFGASRESALEESMAELPPRDLAAPQECPSLTSGMGEGAPAFTRHFEARLARGALPCARSEGADHWIWVRHVGANDRGGVDGCADSVALLALADMPPPAVLSRLDFFAPVSSVNWHVNVLDDAPISDQGGWWLLRQRAEHAKHGFSSQEMLLYGANGGLVLAGRQLVAVYA